MTGLMLRAVVLAGALTALPGLAAAQFPPPPPPASVQDRWPEAAPSERSVQTVPVAPAAPAADPPAATPAKPKAAAAPATSVSCGGVFGRESTHLKLAARFDSRNVVFSEIDGPEGSKLNGTVIYPNDPKRRLEVLWNNEAARSDTQVIAITGRSQWTGPKGLRIGMPLAALEKANGRPFKLSGLDKDGQASVLGWEGGTLSNLPGGCRVGIKLTPDRKAADASRATLAGDKEFLSNEAAVRTLKPAVAEVLLGY